MVAYAALASETIKARRSLVPWVTLLGSAIAPIIGGLFMLIFKEPAWALRFGLLTTKAQLTISAADWPTYFGFLMQAVAIGGVLLFGMFTIWMFGREWSDRTITDLLALPTPRYATVGAKFVVIICWSFALTAAIFGLGLGIGAAVGLDGWSVGLAVASAGRILVAASLTICVVLPLGYMASAGRGYLVSVGAMFLLIVLAQILAVLGWGAIFPWSVPALYSGAAGADLQHLPGFSYAIVALTALVGVCGTLGWWQYAEQH